MSVVYTPQAVVFVVQPWDMTIQKCLSGRGVGTTGLKDEHVKHGLGQNVMTTLSFRHTPRCADRCTRHNLKTPFGKTCEMWERSGKARSCTSCGLQVRVSHQCLWPLRQHVKP